MADSDRYQGVPIPCSYFIAVAEKIRRGERSNSMRSTVPTADRSNAFDNLDGTSQGIRVGSHADNISAYQWDEFKRGPRHRMLRGPNLDRNMPRPAQHAPLSRLLRSDSVSDRIGAIVNWGGAVSSTLSIPPTREDTMPDPFYTLENFQPDIYPLPDMRARRLKTQPFLPIVQASDGLELKQDQITQEEARDMDAFLDYGAAVEGATKAAEKDQRLGEEGVGEVGEGDGDEDIDL